MLPGMDSDNRGQGPSCEPASRDKRRVVGLNDLPLSCPLPGECLWDSHPRVYLPFTPSGRTRCPYCGVEYILDVTKDLVNPGG